MAGVVSMLQLSYVPPEPNSIDTEIGDHQFWCRPYLPDHEGSSCCSYTVHGRRFEDFTGVDGN